MVLSFDDEPRPPRVIAAHWTQSGYAFGAATVVLFIVCYVGVSYLSLGCLLGVRGKARDLGPGADQAAVKGVGLDARGAEEVTGAIGLDASSEANTDGTQGATTVTGEGATVNNIQLVGGGSGLAVIVALALVIRSLRKSKLANDGRLGHTIEGLDRVLSTIWDANAVELGKSVKARGRSLAFGQGEVRDAAEIVIRERLDKIGALLRNRTKGD